MLHSAILQPDLQLFLFSPVGRNLRLTADPQKSQLIFTVNWSHSLPVHYLISLVEDLDQSAAQDEYPLSDIRNMTLHNAQMVIFGVNSF